jgi:hypothetical protein
MDGDGVADALGGAAFEFSGFPGCEERLPGEFLRTLQGRGGPEIPDILQIGAALGHARRLTVDGRPGEKGDCEHERRAESKTAPRHVSECTLRA